MSKVAMFGAGMMGSAMVRRMLEHGEQVRVWNRTPRRHKRSRRTARPRCRSGGHGAWRRSRAYHAFRRRGGRRAPRKDLRSDSERRRHHRSHDGSAEGDARALRAHAKGGHRLLARAGLHVAARSSRGQWADSGLGSAGAAGPRRRRAAEDDRQGMGSRTTPRQSGCVQTVR